MKKTTLFILAFLGLTALVSCEVEMSPNGKLDGFWHVENIDTVAEDGKTINVGDKREAKLYWAFQFNMLQIDDRTYATPRYILRFEHNKDTLRVYDPYLFDRENGDKKLEDPTPLIMYGIDALDAKFIIKSLSNKRVTLKKGNLEIKMRKF